MPVDPELLAATLDRLESIGPSSVEEALQRAVDTATDVFSVTGAGLMVLDDTETLRYVAASDEAVRVLEQVQEQTGEGPCVDCFVLGTTVTTDDATDDERWPSLASRLRGTGVRAVLGTPIHVAGGPVGSLNVYADAARPWDESDRLAVAGFSHLIEHALGVAILAHARSRVVDQLQYALDHRVVIERAIGMMMGRDGLDAVTAFNRLRQAARDSGRKVGDVAAGLLAGDTEVW
jgi:GAF domain-containing protein